MIIIMIMMVMMMMMTTMSQANCQTALSHLPTMVLFQFSVRQETQVGER